MADLTEFIVVLITAPSPQVAEELADAVMAQRLAACVNIMPTMRSIFRWNGAIQREQETLLLLKSRAALFNDIVALIAPRHPYDVPEIIALPVQAGLDAYLRWIDRETS